MSDPTTFSYNLLRSLQDRIELTERALLEGSPREFSEYKELVGELNGLKFCEMEIKELLKKSEE
tara:strand:+ start:293 stop:484 length:192 start_codon:yes stop_codon:yes gene_type:complete